MNQNFFGTTPGPIQFATNRGLLGAFPGSAPSLDTPTVSGSAGPNGSIVLDAKPIADQALDSGNMFLAASTTLQAMN
jgi:hypothetical protein